MQQVDHVIFVSHPYAWKSQYPNGGSNVVYGGFTGTQLVGMEGDVANRWLAAVSQADSHTAIVINGASSSHIAPDGPMAPLFQAVQQHMPGRSLVTIQNATESYGPHIVQQFQALGCTISPQATWEAWGQSTEGCAPNWAGHIAAGLGITQGIPLEYNLTFPDAAFAMTGTFLQRINLGGTDVYGYISQSQSGTPFAIYFPGVAHDTQAQRYVSLTASASAVSFTNKQGAAVTVSHSGNNYYVPLGVDPAVPVYVWANSGTSLSDFENVLAAGTVVTSIPVGPKPSHHGGANGGTRS